MSRMLLIFLNNRKTFYRFDNGEEIRLGPSYFVKLIFSLLVATLIFGKIGDITPTILTAQSVLLGFGFSLMFFLLSNPINRDLKEISLEREVKIEKLKILSKEIFYNVAYFNLITISSIVFCMLFLTCKIGGELLTGLLSNNFEWLECIFYFSSILFVLLLVLTVIEGLHTFLRTLMRVDYYFSKRMELER